MECEVELSTHFAAGMVQGLALLHAHEKIQAFPVYFDRHGILLEAFIASWQKPLPS